MTNESYIRAFFAIEVPTSVAQQIALLTRKINTIPIHWNPLERLHITLRFFEHVHLTELSLLCEKMKNAISVIHPFSIQLKSISPFPSNHSHLIALEPLHESQALTEIVTIIRQSCNILQFPDDKKPFRCHITLGKILKTNQQFETIHTESLNPIHVDHITLFHSHIQNNKRVYTILERIFLDIN
ncbi:MAG: RNA 2',3'-cyclic phosphodiesterase [Gammaproteobacteria bacterium]|nr:RNA 2',3'-cyclic phosphodiesterase [Gammaproteobacteria bacterium]